MGYVGRQKAQLHSMFAFAGSAVKFINICAFEVVRMLPYGVMVLVVCRGDLSAFLCSRYARLKDTRGEPKNSSRVSKYQTNLLKIESIIKGNGRTFS